MLKCKPQTVLQGNKHSAAATCGIIALPKRHGLAASRARSLTGNLDLLGSPSTCWLHVGDANYVNGNCMSRYVFKSSVLAACLLALAACLGGTVAACAQGVVKSKHGDWELRCETPPGAQREQCALIQSVAAEDKPNINLVVIVLKTADNKSRLLRVIAPLGVLLPSGLGLNMDGQDIGRAGFVRCLLSGCVAEVVMEDKLLEQLKGGKTATFVIFQTPEEGVGIPLNLNGFKDGFEKLP